jgi:hypothetical protein
VVAGRRAAVWVAVEVVRGFAVEVCAVEVAGAVGPEAAEDCWVVAIELVWPAPPHPASASAATSPPIVSLLKCRSP